MSSLTKPLCAILGHRRDRRRVWNDGIDLRAPCMRCGTPLIRSEDKGWRRFDAEDANPDRISRDAYRDQLMRENALSGANADQPDYWAEQWVAAYADPARRVDPASLFDRLLDHLMHDPAFAPAVASGRLGADARLAVGAAVMQILGASRPPPSHLLDPLARYLHARAQETAALVNAAA
jgi:hypothetical protein